VIIEIQDEDADAVASALRKLADHYRADVHHDPAGVAALHASAAKLDEIADDIDARIERLAIKAT
jgi:hypothetical protein